MVVLVFALLVAPTPGELAATRHTDPVPASVAPAIARKLAPGGPRVNTGTATVTLWFVSALPLKEGTAAPSWADTDEGSLVGVVAIDKDTRDIRGRVVRAGTYTLRYGIQPANSDHVGVSPYREFLLLCPITEDIDPAPRGHDGTIDMSKHTVGGAHPAVWSIDPPTTSEALLSTHTTELGHKAVIVEVPATRDGTSAGALRFGIVLIGKIET